MILRHICLYTSGPDFHCVRAGGCASPPEVVQEALADLKNSKQIKKEERYFPQGIFWIFCQLNSEKNTRDWVVGLKWQVTDWSSLSITCEYCWPRKHQHFLHHDILVVLLLWLVLLLLFSIWSYIHTHMIVMIIAGKCLLSVLWDHISCAFDLLDGFGPPSELANLY